MLILLEAKQNFVSACGSSTLLIRGDSQHVRPAETVSRAGEGSPGTGANLALLFLLLHASNDLGFFKFICVFLYFKSKLYIENYI